MENKDDKKEIIFKNADEKLEVLKKLVLLKKKTGVDTSTMERLLKEAEKAIQGKDIKIFLTKAKELALMIKGETKKPVKRKLAKVPKKVDKLEVIAQMKKVKRLLDGGDFSEDKIIQAKELFEKGQSYFREEKMVRSLTTLKAAERILTSKEEAKGKEEEKEREEEVEKKSKEADAVLNLFFEKISKIKEFGGDLTPIDEHIRFIEDAKKGGDLYSAADTAKPLLEWLDQYISSFKGEKIQKEEGKKEEKEEIERFMKKVKELENLGGDLSSIQEHLKFVNDSLSTGDVNRALETIRSLKEWVNKYLGTLTTAHKEEIKEEEKKREEERVEKEVKTEKEGEEEKNEDYRRKIDCFLKKVEELKKLGGDISSIKEHIDYIHQKEREGDLSGASSATDPLMEWVNNYLININKERYENAKSKISDMFSTLKGLEEELPEEYKKEWEEVQKFKESEEAIERIQDFSNKLNKYVQDIKKRISEKIKKNLEKVDHEIGWLKERGVDLSELLSIKEKALESLKGMNYKVAMELSKKFINATKKWFAQVVKNDFKFYMDKVDQIIQEIRSGGGDADEVEKKKEDAQKLLENDSLLPSLERIKDTLLKGEEIKKRIVQDKIELLRNSEKDFKAKIEDIGRKGANITPLQRILSILKDSIESGEINKALEAKDRLDLAYNNLHKMNLKERLDEFNNKIEKILNHFEDEDIDVDEKPLTTILEKINNSFSGNRLDEVEKLLDEGENSLKNYREGAYHQLYQKRMIPVINTIKHLKEQGTDLGVIEKKLDEVKDLFNKADYEEWESNLAEIWKTLNAYEANLTLKELREIVLKLSEIDASYEKYGEEYNDSLKLYQKGGYKEALEKAKRALINSKKELDTVLWLKMSEELNTLIEKAKGLMLNVDSYISTLNSSKIALANKDAVKANDLLKKSIESIKVEIEKAELLKKEREELKEKLNERLNRIVELSRKGLPTAPATEKANEIKKFLEDNMLEDGSRALDSLDDVLKKIEMGGKTVSKEESVPSTSVAQELSTIISQLKENISYMKERNMDTKKYQSDLLNILQTFKEGRFDKAVTLGKKCLENITNEISLKGL